MKRAKHFDVWQWGDFVRDVVESSARPAMEDHLASGCRRCLSVVRSLQGLAEAARHEAEYQPSANIIRRAEAIFPVHRPETSILARLIYDSFRQPLPAGLRTQGRVARHALYEAGTVFVDLQLEHEPSSGKVSLVGQIADQDHPGINTTSLPVLLMARRRLVASAMCNRLGEFEMEFRPGRDLQLHVPLRETGAHIDLRMDELSPVPGRRSGGPPSRSRRAVHQAQPRRRVTRKTRQ